MITFFFFSAVLFSQKDKIDVEIKALLTLKAEFKSASGKDWKPGMEILSQTPAASPVSSDASDLDAKITAQGNKVRDLKTAKAEKVNIYYLHQNRISCRKLSVYQVGS